MLPNPRLLALGSSTSVALLGHPSLHGCAGCPVAPGAVAGVLISQHRSPPLPADETSQTGFLQHVFNKQAIREQKGLRGVASWS